MSDAALFDRRCRLTIANPVDTPNDFKNTTTDVIEIDGGATDDEERIGMRIQFNIKKTLKKEPNAGEITVSNLSPDRRASLQKKGVRVLLEAGYRDTGLSRIFSGDVRTIDHVRKGPDWETVMRLGDGERAWQFSRVYVSFAPGSTARDVLTQVADAMGVDAGNVDQFGASINKTFDQGYALVGSASRAMDRLAKTLAFTWSVQNGQLQVLAKDGKVSGSVPEISPTSGLIGSPEMGTPTTKGKPALTKVRALLMPITPGQLVSIKSERYPRGGNLKVESCEFTGDTSGGNWYVDIAGSIEE